MELLEKMATYVRVVEAGSLSAAAKQLRISPAAVSRQIATLERELRVPLLRRTTRRMSVTPAGRSYYERALRVLREVDDAQAIGRTAATAGLLSASAPVTFGLACVVPQLSSFMTAHPGLRVDLRLEDRPIDLALEGVDLAVRVGGAPPDSTDVIAHELMSFRRVLVAAPSYLKSHGAPGTPEALAKHDALAGALDSWTLATSRASTEAFRGRRRLRPSLPALVAGGRPYQEGGFATGAESAARPECDALRAALQALKPGPIRAVERSLHQASQQRHRPSIERFLNAHRHAVTLLHHRPDMRGLDAQGVAGPGDAHRRFDLTDRRGDRQPVAPPAETRPRRQRSVQLGAGNLGLPSGPRIDVGEHRPYSLQRRRDDDRVAIDDGGAFLDLHEALEYRPCGLVGKRQPSVKQARRG